MQIDKLSCANSSKKRCETKRTLALAPVPPTFFSVFFPLISVKKKYSTLKYINTTVSIVLYKLKHMLTMNTNLQEILVQIKIEFQVIRDVIDYIYMYPDHYKPPLNLYMLVKRLIIYYIPLF